MRKNYFAKKFVAYSMAFAVAFSTLTVSPVFVKDAKADTDLMGAAPFAYAAFAGSDLTTVKAFLQSVETTAGTSTVSVGDIAKNEELNVSDVKVVSIVTDPKSELNTAPTLNGNATVKYDDMKIATGVSPLTYADNSNSGKDSKTKFVVNGQNKDISNVSVELTTSTSGAKWYKLDKVTNTITRGAAGTETVSYVMYKATEVTDGTSNATLELGTVENNEFGYYVSSDGMLYNVVEISDLFVEPERTTYEAKKGSSVTLTVNAKSSKGNLTYTWKKGTTKLSETTGALTIEDVDNTKTGSYTCIVSDGVCSKDVTMQLSIATADTKRPIAYQSFAKYVKAVDENDRPITDAYKLPGGVTTLKSCVPSQEDYRYVWEVTTPGTTNGTVGTGQVARTTTDILNYEAKNNIVTITDNVEKYENAEVTCYVLYKDTYEALSHASVAGGKTIGKLLEDLKDATNDVDKKSIKDDILEIEEKVVANTVGLKTALYTEEFTFVPENEEVLSAEYITKSVGDSVAITLPSKDSFITESVTSVTFNELNKDFVRTQLVAKDFGYQRIKVSDQSSNVLTDKYVNIVYTPDLTVSAKNATAKVGDKLQLSVTADSKLPLSYTWQKVTTNPAAPSNKSGDVTDPSKLTISSVAANDLYQPEELYVDGSKKVEEANYYVCTVDNGIEQKKVKITISKNGGFEYKDVEANPFVTDKEASYTKYALANTNTSFAPIIKEGTGAKLTYAWYKYAVGTDVISTDKKLTVDFDGKADVRYVLVITDEASSQKATINYTLKTLKTEDITGIGFAPGYTIPAQKYTGSEIKPAFDLTVNTAGGNLVLASTDLNGTDFNVTYENNVNTGVARIIVTVDKKGDTSNKHEAKTEFYIDRADNEVEIADKTVVLGGSVQPKTVKNVAKSALTYEYFTDEACTNEIEVPSKVGTYFVKATSAATANYNDATSNVATVKVVPGKVKMLGTSRTASSVKLNWNKATGATSYRVYYKAPGAKSYKVFKNTTATSMNVTGLASATTYTFAVKAYAKTAGY